MASFSFQDTSFCIWKWDGKAWPRPLGSVLLPAINLFQKLERRGKECVDGESREEGRRKRTGSDIVITVTPTGVRVTTTSSS